MSVISYGFHQDQEFFIAEEFLLAFTCIHSHMYVFVCVFILLSICLISGHVLLLVSMSKQTLIVF